MVVLEAPLLLEGDEALRLVPVLAVHLVAPDVEVRVGEEGSHLAEEAVQEVEHLLPGGIQGGVHDPPLPLDRVRAGHRGELGVAHEPARRVAGDVELRVDPDPALARVRDDLLHLLLRVEEAVRAHPVELGVKAALHAEPLVVGEVPVERVQLHGRHAVERPLHHVERHEVARAVEHQAAPGEAGPVPHDDLGQAESARRASPDELQERLHAAQDSPRLSSLEHRALRPHRQRVALVHPEVRQAGARSVAPDLEARLAGNRDRRGQDEPRLPGQPRLEPPRCALDDRTALPDDGNPEPRSDHHLARPLLDRGRPRHEGGTRSAPRRRRRQGQHRHSESHRVPPAWFIPRSIGQESSPCPAPGHGGTRGRRLARYGEARPRAPAASGLSGPSRLPAGPEPGAFRVRIRPEVLTRSRRPVRRSSQLKEAHT